MKAKAAPNVAAKQIKYISISIDITLEVLSAISLDFHAAFTSVVQAAVHIAETSTGSADKSVSTKIV